MKKRQLRMFGLALFGTLAAVFQGCAANSAQGGDDQLKALEKQLMQLKAENANLQARTRELDDKVLLFEKKQTLATQKSAEAGLRTVRLTPDGEVMDDPMMGSEDPEMTAEEEASVSFRDAFSEKKEKRPVLQLNEGSFAAYDAAPVSNRAPVASSLPRPYDNIPMTNRGDNLGVMTADGQLEQAEADSMEVFNTAYRSYNNKDYGAALAGFSAFLQKESNHKFADNAMFWIAECYLAQGKLFQAVGEFERLLHRYPGSEQASSALYRIGFIYDRMEDSAKAMEYYFKVVEQYPGSDAARKASKRLSDNGGNTRLVRTSAKR